MNILIFTLFVFLFGLLILWLFSFIRDRHLQGINLFWVLLSGGIVYFLYLDMNNYNYLIFQKIERIQSIINTYLNIQLPDNKYYYLNIFILYSFALFKLCFNVFGAIIDRLRTNKSSFQDLSSRAYLAYEYHKKKKSFYLKPKWVHIKLFFMIGSAMTLIFYVYQLMFDLYPYVTYLNNPLRFPVLQILFFFEFTWYLGGNKRINDRINSNDTFQLQYIDRVDNHEKLRNIDAIWNHYKFKEVEHIKDYKIRLQKSKKQIDWQPNTNQSNYQLEFEIIFKNLEKNENISLYFEDVTLKDSGYAILNALWKNEDVLITCPVYEKVAPFLFASLQRDILEQHKIVVLIDAIQQDNPHIEEWIRQWMKETIYAQSRYNIETHPKFNIKKNDYEDIWITSVNELLDKGWKIDAALAWLRQLKTVVVFNIQQVIFPNLQAATTLFQKLSDTTKRKLQIILLSTEKHRNTASSIREYLTALPNEFHLSNFPGEDIHIKIWRYEDSTNLRNELIAGCPSYISPEIALCIPALKEEAHSIHIIGTESSPWQDSIESVDIFSQSQTGSLSLSKKAANAVDYHPIPYVDSFNEYNLIIAYDHSHNIVTALNSTFGLQRKKSYVHIVSPPYMLREYLSENLDFFQSRYPDALVSLSPTMMRNNSNTAYCLANRLNSNYLLEDDISRHINRITLKTDDNKKELENKIAIEDQLIKLFNDIYGESNYFNQMDLSYDDIFSNNSFEKKIKIKLNNIESIKNSIKDDYFQVIDGEKNVLHTIRKDHVYQSYLPGQLHSFKGRLFRIISVDNNNKSGKVIAEKEPIPSVFTHYRQINHIKCDAANRISESFQKKQLTNYMFTKELYESKITIVTQEYYAFTKGLDFDSGFTIHSLQDYKIPEREYSHGRMLKIGISSYPDPDVFANKEKISPILCFLLNELFRSVFPQYFQYIHATTYSFNNSKQNNTTETDKDRLLSLIPTFQYPKNNQRKGVSVFIIEDSSHDMGLIKAVYDNLDYLFQVLEDFLTWSLQQNKIFTHYSCKGSSVLTESENIKQTRNLLRDIIDNDIISIRSDREKFYKQKEPSSTQTRQKCDFCPNYIEGFQYVKTDDGKIKCHKCRFDYVNTQEELDEYLKHLSAWISDAYKIVEPVFNDIKFTTSKQINKRYGKQKRIVSDRRVISYVESDMEGNTLYIEKNKSYPIVIAAIAREMTLFWQKEKLNIEQINARNTDILENHALWVGIKYLEQKNNSPTIVEDYCKRMYDTSSFKTFETLLKQKDVRNPFELLENEFSDDILDNESEPTSQHESIFVRFFKKFSSFFWKKRKPISDTEMDDTNSDIPENQEEKKPDQSTQNNGSFQINEKSKGDNQ